jgi:hypothetical protein
MPGTSSVSGRRQGGGHGMLWCGIMRWGGGIGQAGPARGADGATRQQRVGGHTHRWPGSCSTGQTGQRSASGRWCKQGWVGAGGVCFALRARGCAGALSEHNPGVPPPHLLLLGDGGADLGHLLQRAAAGKRRQALVRGGVGCNCMLACLRRGRSAPAWWGGKARQVEAPFACARGVCPATNRASSAIIACAGQGSQLVAGVKGRAEPCRG